MKVICPEHQGVIYVPGDFSAGISKNLVIECPVCNEQVLITHTKYFDDEHPNSSQLDKKQILK